MKNLPGGSEATSSDRYSSFNISFITIINKANINIYYHFSSMNGKNSVLFYLFRVSTSNWKMDSLKNNNQQKKYKYNTITALTNGFCRIFN